MMRHSLVRSRHGALATLALAAGALVALAPGAPGAGALGAQVRQPASVQPMPELHDDHGTRPAPRSGFALFGNADIAFGALRYSGIITASITNFEPCQNIGNIRCGMSVRNGVAAQQLFLWTVSAGAGVSDFRKIRQAHPGANNMLGPTGYTYLSTGDLVGAPRKWGAHDGTLGTSFSGIGTETSGSSCRVKNTFATGFILTSGLSLLEHSDCPPTWVGDYSGPRRVPEESFKRLFDQDPSAFHFDWHDVPRELTDTTKFLGAFSTFAEMTDYTRDLLPLYGAVTPAGTGVPQLGGYPLGLYVRTDMFNFNATELASTVFYRMTIVNNSDRVWGTGIDYDSLYFGLAPGFINNQRGVYYDPARNTVWGVVNGLNANCNNSSRPTGTQGCSAAAAGGFRAQDGIAFVVLKSPIGDERNKLLTRPGLFFNPASPFADDTITFNHGHHCGFGPDCSGTTIQSNTRRGFGMVSSTESNVLDGRDPSTFTPIQMWRTFRSKDFTGNVGPDVAKFNKFVPGTTPGFGGWDYDNDGDQDTLYLDTCAERGCVRVMADTMPGKQTIGYSNVDGVLTAGPFRLPHHDTVSFVIAMTVSNDSIGLENNVAAARAAYLNFFLGAEPPPAPRITSTEVRSTVVADAQNLAPQVRLFFSSDPETWVDPFLTKFADDLEAATDSARVILRTLNPDLVTEIRAAARANFADLLVFKSCDGGTTFTGDNDCDSDPTATPTGGSATLPFQAYGRLVPDASGQVANIFTDDNVQGGRTYLYSLVARSRGFRRAVTVRSPGSTVQRDTIIVVADTLAGVIARTGPSTAQVYVPVSLPAGAAAPRAVVTTLGGNARVPVVTRVGQNARTGRYRVVFGNRFTVTIRTTIRTNEAQSTVTVRDAYASASVGGTAATNYATDSTVFSGAGRVEFSGVAPTFTTTSDGITQVETATFTAPLGFVLAGPDGTPYFVSTDLTAAGSTPPAFLGRGDFPGFVLEVVQANADVLTTEQVVEPDGDSLVLAVRNSSALQWREQETVRLAGRGVYEVQFAAESFGSGAPFTLATPQATETAVLASFAARATATTASVDANAVATVRASIAGLAAATFVEMKFPFRVVGPNGEPAILVAADRNTLPAAQRFSSIVIGSGADTVRVTPPADTWVPGDRFYILQAVLRDSVAAGATVIGDTTIGGQVVKRPIQVRDTVVAFGPAMLGCNSPRTSCNPVAFNTPGATGYLPFGDDWKIVIDYPEPFTLASDVALDIEGPTPPPGRLAADVLRQVRVVPNPYVVLSDFDAVTNRVGESRVLFTGVPAEGTLRIYSVSGQYLQQLRWNASDLNGTGDLAYNLRTREGTDLASGLYIYVLTPGGANAGSPVVRGKFTVIR